MNHLKFFESFSESPDNYIESKYLISSKKGVYLFEFSSYDGWSSFLEENKLLYEKLKWAINPEITTSAETYFNYYLEKYPTFCFIVDENKNMLYGASLDKEYIIGSFLDQAGNMHPFDLFTEYLNKLNLTIEDL